MTLRLDDPGRLDSLRDWGALRGWKLVHIVLARGLHPSQPMLTRRAQGTLERELGAARGLAAELAGAGFDVSRVKIEAAPWNGDVPVEDEAAARSPGRYFEHHVKLLLGSDADHDALRSAVEEHAAHLSRNAFRNREDGHYERFVTQRCYSVGRETARRRLETLLAALEPLGYPILEVEEEYVVYDSDPLVDSGWIWEGAR